MFIFITLHFVPWSTCHINKSKWSTWIGVPRILQTTGVHVVGAGPGGPGDEVPQKVKQNVK